MHESLPNTIDYVEMPSRDLAQTKNFFSALFGWSFQDYGPDYIAFDDGRFEGFGFHGEHLGMPPIYIRQSRSAQRC